MTDGPNPGTVAYHNPEPGLVTEVRRLVSEGMAGTCEAALPGSKDRYLTEAAHTYWVRRMRRFASDDHAATRVLLILDKVMRDHRRVHPSPPMSDGP